jgi:transposase
MDTASMKGYGLLFIPPYTPEANPIELIFGVLKNAYYKLRYQPDFESVPLAVQHALSMLSNVTISSP